MKGQQEATRKACCSSEELMISRPHFLQRISHSLLLQFVKFSKGLGNV